MRQAKKPQTEERQNASMPPNKWTCPRKRTPATANTSYAVPQRRSRRRLAGSPKPPMESRQAHSIHGVALSKASSRPRCATRSIPTPRCRARPHPNPYPKSPPTHPPPATPTKGTNKKPQQGPDCRLPRGVKTRMTPGKAVNRTHNGPFPPRGGRKGVRNRKKVAQESEFLFLRNGSS